MSSSTGYYTLKTYRHQDTKNTKRVKTKTFNGEAERRRENQDHNLFYVFKTINSVLFKVYSPNSPSLRLSVKGFIAFLGVLGVSLKGAYLLVVATLCLWSFKC